MNELAHLIHEEIRPNDVISFEQFMEHALYEPDLGYYETQREVGKKGDFFTSVSVGPLFGELLAFQFSQSLEGIDGSIQLIEAGAHNGQLSCDILNALKQWHPNIYENVSLIFVESSKQHKQWQAQALNEHKGKVEWRGEVPEKFYGIFSVTNCSTPFPFNDWVGMQKRKYGLNGGFPQMMSVLFGAEWRTCRFSSGLKRAYQMDM